MRSLLDAAAALAREATSWQAEGSLVARRNGQEPSTEEFKITYRQKAAAQARLEVTSGSNPLLRICDGNSQWTYYAKTNSYVRVILNQIGPCAYPINAWPGVSFLLPSPRLAGTDRLTLGGAKLDCRVIQGTSPGGADTEVCIDPATKLIARFQTGKKGPAPMVQTYTFSLIERNVTLDADLFVFHPPSGSREIGVISWLEPGIQPNGDAVRVSNQLPPPALISATAPESSGGNSSAWPSGSVGLYVEISEAGIPRYAQVLKSSRPELNERAIETVKQWRFGPSAKPLVTAIVVNFYAQ